MSESTAIDLLTYALKRKDMLQDQTIVTELLIELQYLPLAINQAVAYMNSKKVSPARCFDLLQGTEKDLVYMLSKEIHDRN